MKIKYKSVSERIQSDQSPNTGTPYTSPNAVIEQNECHRLLNQTEETRANKKKIGCRFTKHIDSELIQSLCKQH